MHKLVTGLAFGLFASSAANAVGLDGLFDGDYTHTAHVTYSASAPNSNFSTPTAFADHASYDIYMKTDADYWYGYFKASEDAPIIDTFANLYFDLDPSAGNGSDLGFEINTTRTNVFVPGRTSTFPPQAVTDILTGSTNSHRLEIAIPLSYFSAAVSGVPYYDGQTWDGQAVLRLSQSFGYSVAGGDSYGDNRLGSFAAPGAVPEPASWALMIGGFGTIGFALRRRRKTAVSFG